MHYLYSILAYAGALLSALGVVAIIVFGAKDKNQPEAKNQNAGASLLIVFAVILFIVGHHYWNADPNSGSEMAAAPVKPSPNPTAAYISAGQDAKLKSQGLAAATKETHDQLVNFMVAGNQDAVKRMMDQGEVVSLAVGTPVTVLDRTTGVAHIEILDGPYKGNKGYIIIESLEPK